jgi:hypothetical protein
MDSGQNVAKSSSLSSMISHLSLGLELFRHRGVKDVYKLAFEDAVPYLQLGGVSYYMVWALIESGFGGMLVLRKRHDGK